MSSTNGLLVPPDLWTAVATNSVATSWYSLMARQTGVDYRQPVSDAVLFTRLRSEVGDQTATWITSRTSTHAITLLKSSCPKFPAWQRTAIDNGNTRAAWQVRAASKTAGCTTAIEATQVNRLRTWMASPDVMRAWFASDMLQGAEGHAKLPNRHQLADPADAATYLRLRVEQGASVDSDKALYQQARDEARLDDQSLYELVDMQIMGGHTEEARQLVASLGYRVQADGWISAPPDFQGTLGSTAKMLAWSQEGGDIAPLTDTDRAGLLHAVEHSDKQSTLAEVAAATIEQQLTGRSLSQDQKAELITKLADEWHISAHPLTSATASVAWAELAGYAQQLDTPLPFPGMSDSAIHQWDTSPLDSAAPVMARVVIRAAHAGSTRDPSIQHLAGLLTSSRRHDSLTIIPANLAVHLAQGRWLMPVDQLQALVQRRKGRCLGGSDVFLRDSDTPGTPCYLETSRYALEIQHDLNR